MKLYNLVKKSICAMLSTSLILTAIAPVYADTVRTYKFSDISTQVDIPTSLYAFTRNVTSADPNLSLISATADQLHVTFEQYGIYLEAFPEDVSYEVVISGHTADESEKNFNTLNSEELNIGLQKYKELSNSVETDDVLGASLYKNDTTSFYKVDLKSIANGITVYIQKYYTVMEGKQIAFTIQSKGKVLDENQQNIILDIVNSAQFMEIKSSITESPIFTELLNSVVGFAIVIGILGLVVFVVSKSTKKRK